MEPFRSKYLTAILVAAAGVEAAGLLAGAAYLLEGRILALVAGGICALAILASLPTQRRVNDLLASRPRD